MSKNYKQSYNKSKGNYYDSQQSRKKANMVDDLFEKSLSNTNQIKQEYNDKDVLHNENNKKNFEKYENINYEESYDYNQSGNYDYTGNDYYYNQNYFNNNNNKGRYNNYKNKQNNNNKFNTENFTQEENYEYNKNNLNYYENKSEQEYIPYKADSYATNDNNLINIDYYNQKNDYYKLPKSQKNKNYNDYENKNDYYYENTPGSTNNNYSNEHSYHINKDNQYYEQATSVNKNNKQKNRKKNRQGQSNNANFTEEEKIKKQKADVESFLEKLSNKAPEQTYNLINELIDSEYECMICNDIINQNQETWSCDKCHTIYHIKCIYDWIFKLNSDKAIDSSKSKDKKIAAIIFKWSCPHCSCYYNATTDTLPKYNCYCKRFYKAEEGYKKNLPEYKNFNPNFVPHGCGLICNAKVCRHMNCGLMCHPGPHLQCNEIESLTCYCGNSTKKASCTSLQSSLTLEDKNKNGGFVPPKFQCDKKCDKMLNCKRHKCPQICHEGDCEAFFKNKKCEECTIEAKMKFMTFLKNLEIKIKADFKKEVKLAEDLADYIFHGLLLCKNHYLETNTDENLRLLLKLIQVSGVSLIENLKKFIPLCKESVMNSCVCQNKSKKTECYRVNYKQDLIEFLNLLDQKETALGKCSKTCKALKSCKIHTCDRVCCELANVKITNYSRDDPEGLHLCLITCGKELNCGLHKCENYCHRGNCLPCKTIIREGESLCDCGETILKAPFVCGRKPVCSLPCSKPRSCPHPCELRCHSGPCPPCGKLVIKICNCGKTAIENVKCGETNLPKCNVVCEEVLPCGAHFCDVVCHDHTEDYDKNYFCNLTCGRVFQYCKHQCKKRCHGDKDCYEIECDTKIKLFCKCKINSKDFRCGEAKKLTNNFRDEYYLPCNDECKRIERLKKIEIAFDGLFKYNQEKNRQLLKGLNKSKNQELTKKQDSAANKLIVRNFSKTDDGNKEVNSNDSEKIIDNENIDQESKEEVSTEENKKNYLEHNLTISAVKTETNDTEYEEYTKKICDVKFSCRNLIYAFDKVKFIMELENTAEKALKSLTTKHEINSLDKKQFIFASEFLRTYYNLETEKIKKGTDLSYHILLKNCDQGKIPRVKLSLLALLLKSHKFVNIPLPKENQTIPKNKIIYHPFEMSIYIQDYRLHVTPEAIDAHISTIVTSDKYYVNEINKGKCYIHFFDKYNCKKVFKELKSKPSQFQDCYEVSYYHDENWRYEDFYLYLINDEYFKYLNELYEDGEHELIFEKIKNSKNKNFNSEEQESKELDQPNETGKSDYIKSNDLQKPKDDDGFTVVTKKKKNK